jgi:hypothetical protein
MLFCSRGYTSSAEILDAEISTFFKYFSHGLLFALLQPEVDSSVKDQKRLRLIELMSVLSTILEDSFSYAYSFMDV